MIHYHIRWSGQNRLDWERFDSDADAVVAARQLKRLGETFTIEERDESCENCRASYILKTGRDLQEPKPQVEEPAVEYPWHL